MPMAKEYIGTNVSVFPAKESRAAEVQEPVQAGVPVPPVLSSTTTGEKLPNSDKFARQTYAVERIKTQFADAFGREMPRSIQQQVLLSIRSGTPAAYYTYAIEETLLAPRPSWRYTMAIVRRLEQQMIDQDDLNNRIR